MPDLRHGHYVLHQKQSWENVRGGIVRDSLKPRATGIGWRRRDGLTKCIRIDK